MDRGKGKGDFSTAYKLSRTADGPHKRLHRRSIEWKEIRRDQAEKRRNISNDLSPVVEDNLSQQQQNKSYKGQTPTKRPGDTQPQPSTSSSSTKTNNRLEMLKKWKAEKEQKKKEEERNKKAPTFKVSGKIDHKDASSLYKNKPVTVKAPTKATVPAASAQTAAVKPAGVKTSTRMQAPIDRNLAKSPQPHGNLRGPRTNMLKKANSPKAAALKKSRSPKSLKRPHSPKVAAASVSGNRVRQTRSTSAQQVSTKPQPPSITRTLRGQTQPKSERVAKAGPTKRKAETLTKPKAQADTMDISSECSVASETPVVPTPHNVSLSKVTTRGDYDDTMASFAPDDTTFSAPANVTSFVFKPLSPASAATFLFPNQDPSTCASFLESKPTRVSTPKSADKEKETKTDETVVQNAAEKAIMEEKSDEAQAETPKAETKTITKENKESETEQKIKSSPSKRRRSTRQSVSHAGESSDNEVVLQNIPTPKPAPVTPGRSTRRSIGQASDMSSDNETVSKPPAVTPARSARKTRRSVLPTVSETDTNSESDVAETEKNIIETPSQSTKKSRRSLRRSVITSSVTEQMETAEEETGSPAKRRRSSRRSVSSAQNLNSVDNELSADDGIEKLSTSLRKSSRKSNICLATEEASDAEKNGDAKEQNAKDTPGRSRRSTGRSNVSQMLEDDVFAEENKQIESEFNKSDTNMVSTPGAEDIDATKEVKSEKRVTRAKFRDNVSENTTPARQKGKAGRKSFGGFAKPNSNSCVLSAKRRARKSMMPKSPEEWVTLLNNSPMVEMSRRTPKTATKAATVTVPPLNFDDIDLENIPPAGDAEPAQVPVSGTREEMGTQTSNLTQPMETLTLGLGDATLMASPMIAASASPVCVQTPNPKAANPQPGTPVTRQSQSANQAASSPEPVQGTSQTQAAGTGPRSPGCSWRNTENLQVEEISSTEDYLNVELLGIKHFRDLLVSERSRLLGLCSLWDDYNESTSDLSDEIRGQIRTVVGQAVLLMNERFKQFSGLVDNCEFKQGEKETTVTDLQGFWDMIYFQVEDVTAKFNSLEKLKNNNWVEDKPKTVAKKVVKVKTFEPDHSKPVEPRDDKTNKKKVTKPSAPKPAVKSKFAAFRAQMKKQKQEELPSSPQKEEEKVFEVPGFFMVASPVRSPRPHCEGGTPKKSSREVTPVHVGSAQNNLEVPSEQPGSGELLNRTPARRSYLPVIPSPLLKDTTPLPRPVRSCTKKTPVPKRLLDQTESMVIDEALPSAERPVETEIGKKTPNRRSLRPRKSVTFDEHVMSVAQDSAAPMAVDSSPAYECSDAEFARLLQPITVHEENEAVDEANDSFSKYLKPSRSLNTSVEKENTPKQSGRRRRSSLKTTKSSEKRRSRGHVQFVSPVSEHEPCLAMPHTPYNRDSLVKQKRVTRHSESSASKTASDVFDIENIDDEDTLSSLPSPFSRSAKQTGLPKQTGRPSLLYTPPKTQNRTPTNKHVPTATLVSFSP